MTTKQELLEKHEELIKAADAARQAAEELKEKIDTLPEEKAERWRAPEGGMYYFINSFGMVQSCIENGFSFDDFRFSTGNYYKTEEQTLQYIDNLITKQKLKDLAFELNGGREVNPSINDWGAENIPIYYLTFGHGTKCLCTNIAGSLHQPAGVVYCTDEHFLEKAIELIDKEALKQYILSGV